MGQKTYESLPIRPLPKRYNIVMTNDNDVNFFGCDIAYDIESAIYKSEYWSNDDEIFIIGGESIYNQFIDIADKLYITKVHENFKGDKYFPEIKFDEWNLLSEKKYKKDNNNEYDYSYLIYEKKYI